MLNNLNISEVRLNLLGRIAAIEAPTAWMDLITELWEPFITDSEHEPEAGFEISPTHKGWALVRDNGNSSVDEDPWAVAHALRNALIGWRLEPPLEFVPLHAGAVTRGGVTLLLPGPAGAGKTTLTTLMIMRGWSYMSDDLVPIDERSLRAHPFPKPLNVRNEHLIKAIGEVWAPPSWLPAPGRSFLVPPAALGPLAPAPKRPTHFLFVRFDPSSRSELKELGPAATAARLVSNVRPLLDPPHALRLLTRLCGEASSATLTLSLLNEGTSLLEAFVSNIAADTREQGAIW